MYMCVCVCIHAFSFQGGVCCMQHPLPLSLGDGPVRRVPEVRKRCKTVQKHTITYGLQLQRLLVSYVTCYVHFKRPCVAESQKQK